MYYGAHRAAQVIQSHPNKDHLLRVLNDTRMEMLQGHQWGRDSPGAGTEPQSDQWSSSDGFGGQGQQGQSQGTFDDDHLLSDEEIARQSQSGMALVQVAFEGLVDA